MRVAGTTETPATWRAARLSALCVGVAAMFLGAFAAVSGWDQRAVPAVWWSAFALPVACGLPAALCVAWRRAPLLRLRWISGLYAAGCLVALATWPVATHAGGLHEGAIPWPANLVLVAIGAAAYAWPARAAFAHMIVLAVVLGLVRHDGAGGGVVASVAVHDALFTVVVGMFVILVLLVVRRGAAHLDAAAHEARDAVAAVAAKRAYASERARLDALVHDTVMTTLTVAARGGTEPTLRGPLARQADRALRELDALRAPGEPSRHLSSADVARRVEAAVASVDPAIPVRTSVSGNPIASAAVGATLAEATAEAVRNSLQHADVPDRAVTRAVDVQVGETGVRVEVRDDGAGFEARDVPDSRLGLSVSIRERLSRAGGVAHVTSRPEHGTTVTLEWSSSDSPVRQAPVPGSDVWFSGTEVTAVTGAFIGVHATLAVANSGVLGNLWPAFLSLGLIAACAVCLGLARRHPLHPAVTATTVLTAPVTAALMSWQLPDQGWPGYGAWHLGADTLLLGVVAARGRVIWAWLGYAAMAAATTIWAGTQAGDTGMGLALSAPHLPTMFVATMIGVALTRSMARAAEHHHERTRSIVDAAAEESRQRERQRRLTYLDDSARPMLERIASPTALDDEDRRDCLLLEAQLRDWIRGGVLSAGAVPAAARRARGRGVAVTLIDDGGEGDHPREVMELVRSQVAAQLDRVDDGHVVARVRPPGRSSLVTVAIEASGSHLRVELDHMGMPVDRQPQAITPAPERAWPDGTP